MNKSTLDALHYCPIASNSWFAMGDMITRLSLTMRAELLKSPNSGTAKDWSTACNSLTPRDCARVYVPS